MVLLWDECENKVKLSVNILSFCKVVFVAAYVEERRVGNLDSLVDACRVLTTKSVLTSVLFPF